MKRQINSTYAHIDSRNIDQGNEAIAMPVSLILSAKQQQQQQQYLIQIYRRVAV